MVFPEPLGPTSAVRCRGLIAAQHPSNRTFGPNFFPIELMTIMVVSGHKITVGTAGTGGCGPLFAACTNRTYFVKYHGRRRDGRHPDQRDDFPVWPNKKRYAST